MGRGHRRWSAVARAGWEWYRKLVTTAFLIVLAGTLCFWRAFAVEKLLSIGGMPVYVIDGFLILALPLAMVGLVGLRRLPALFSGPFWILILLGMTYLGWGLGVARDGFALRGVVLSLYLLLLPLTWALFAARVDAARLVWLMIVCNVVALMVGWSIIFHPDLGNGTILDEIFSPLRTFNLTLGYGMTLAFVLPYGAEGATRAERWLVWVLAGVNAYLIIASGVRSAWIAACATLLFVGIVLRKHWKSLLMAACTMLVCVVGLALLPASKAQQGEPARAYQRAEATVAFIDQLVAPKREVAELPPAASIAYDNIAWRLRVWRQTFRAAMASPCLGAGFRGVLTYDTSVTTRPIRGFAENSGIVPPHNEILTLFYRVGLVGLGLFAWVNGFVLTQGVKAILASRPGRARACLIGAVGSLVMWHGMAQFFDVIDSPPTTIMLWILLGFVLVLVYGGPAAETRAVGSNPWPVDCPSPVVAEDSSDPVPKRLNPGNPGASP